MPSWGLDKFNIKIVFAHVLNRKRARKQKENKKLLTLQALIPKSRVLRYTSAMWSYPFQSMHSRLTILTHHLWQGDKKSSIRKTQKMGLPDCMIYRVGNQLKQVAFSRRVQQQWRLEPGTKILWIHCDEKWFHGIVPRTNAKACPE